MIYEGIDDYVHDADCKDALDLLNRAGLLPWYPPVDMQEPSQEPDGTLGQG